MIVRLVMQTLLSLVVMGAVLFAAAGTLAWLAAWLYLLEIGVVGIWVGLWLARVDPDLLVERMRPFISRDQQAWDRVFMSIVLVGMFAWLALMGFDGVRFGWSRVPLWLNVVGAIAVFVVFWLTRDVYRANHFATPMVEIQHKRGHKVVDSGPYAIVRHPMYAAAMLFFIGTPLMLGSWWGLACMPLLTAALGYRAVREERVLVEGLPGYREYRQRVRYRFVPGVW
ncbi:MAG TPA: isoprenylcysteine carboxylmethyltransferase family protein [Paraburkholderia sp.]|jgi:protein-S-isoprenylcysteine O-methyltransferase Ste14|nr:isoprenylcysteine carboxylmethyltransferase family protein [Paraburkholderia sp.]